MIEKKCTFFHFFSRICLFFWLLCTVRAKLLITNGLGCRLNARFHK